MKTSKYSTFLKLTALGQLLALSGLSAQEGHLSAADLYEEDLEETITVSDPLEAINRYTFEINDFVYMNLLQPLADGYQAITPDPVEEGASNFFANLRYPVRLAGNLLQGRLEGAWVETGRFAINSTVGVAGIFTPADGVNGFEAIPSEDIGQALGSWGLGEGPYLVLPLLGPSNLRDFVGYLGDRTVDPFSEPFSLTNEHNWDWNWEWEAALSATELTVRSPSLVERYVQMKGSSIDPYSALKNGYTQYRRKAIEK
jgi:phospholipid-binding lipoprotein MlaA